MDALANIAMLAVFGGICWTHGYWYGASQMADYAALRLTEEALKRKPNER